MEMPELDLLTLAIFAVTVLACFALVGGLSLFGAKEQSFEEAMEEQEGKQLKALELPGLWNGSMAYWNTVFVQVPIITFNPVKTVLDLLRKEHQPE